MQSLQSIFSILRKLNNELDKTANQSSHDGVSAPPQLYVYKNYTLYFGS